MRAHRPTLIIAAISLVAIVALAASIAPDRFTGGSGSFALGVGVGIVLLFLVALLVRYVILLGLGLLHHVESRRRTIADAPAPMPPVTIIVPAFNEEAVIAQAVRSLLALRYPAYEIVVVDDGSTDATFDRASRMAGRYGAVTVRVVRKGNGGKASALNTGIALARSELVLCMDADSRLDPDVLTAATRHFVDPRIGAVAGNVKVVNRTNLWTRLQALEYLEGLNLPRRAQGFVRAVNIVPGPIGVFRREALTGVGGYDTDTFAEDADLTLKLLTAGWHIAYEDRAVAFTEAPEHLHDVIKQRYRWTRGILQALRKRASWLVSPAGGPVVTLSLVSMAFEAIVWPVMSILGNLLFAIAALAAGAASGVLYWWLLMTLLDVAAALYSVALEEEDLALVAYAVIYRFLFITLIDVAKLLATAEELARVPMTWGKLARAGRI
jgi:cellulose synthase/poly-beta-1,6-N-acetylglucosamine synthase-like glycosyltransferase